MPEPPETKANKTIVYIDGQNFIHRCAESLIKAGAISSHFELTNIDVGYIFRKLFPNDRLSIRYYGVSKVKYREEDEAFNEKAKDTATNLRKIKTNLNNQGIRICNVGQLKVRNSEPCKKCGYQNLKFQEKGVDVGLAVEMVRDAALNLVHKVVLASSDVDLLPALRIVKQLGVETVYVGFKANMTKGLISVADSVREINNLTVLDAYTSALNFNKNS